MSSLLSWHAIATVCLIPSYLMNRGYFFCRSYQASLVHYVKKNLQLLQTLSIMKSLCLVSTKVKFFFGLALSGKYLFERKASYYSLFESETLIWDCFIDIGLERNLAVGIDQGTKFCWSKPMVCSLEYAPGIKWFQTTFPSAQGD